MQKSKLFYTNAYQQIEANTLRLLNLQQDILSSYSLSSPRAAGDAIQEIVAQSFASILGPWASLYSASFARRSMADLAFTDADGYYYIVDVKTHRLDTKFNMPNLTSVERLARFYEDDANYFVLLLISYQVEGARLRFTNAHFVPIEFLDWSCLTIGALGWGQIQLANSNIVVVRPFYSRKQWMLELCDILLSFYPREIEKILKRANHFEKLRAEWAARPES